ncbi:unnamed protein product, partial [Prorocentrum cordatum]
MTHERAGREDDAADSARLAAPASRSRSRRWAVAPALGANRAGRVETNGTSTWPHCAQSRAHSGGTGRAVARLRNGVDDLTPRSRAGWSPLRSAMLEDCLPSGPVCRAVCRGAVRAVRRRRVQRAPPGARELLVRPVASAAPVRRAVRCRPRPQGKGSPRRGRIPLLVP